MLKDKRVTIRVSDVNYLKLRTVADIYYKGNVSKLISGLIDNYFINKVGE